VDTGKSRPRNHRGQFYANRVEVTIVPVQPRTAFIYPYLGDGFTQSGIFVQFNEKLPPVLGVVLAVSEDCQDIKPKDHIIFRPYAFDICSSTQGEIAVIAEAAVAGILETDYE
jgi:hypothetical protein